MGVLGLCPVSAKSRHEVLIHPDSGSKVYYRLRVLIRQGDVLLWLTAFDEIAAIIVGTPASEYGSLDVLGRRKLVDSVVGLHFLVNVKTVKSGFTNFAFAKINPARTKFPDAVLDSIKQPYANEPVYILEHRWPRC